jgi:hypothetical protein
LFFYAVDLNTLLYTLQRGSWQHSLLDFAGMPAKDSPEVARLARPGRDGASLFLKRSWG